MGTSELIMAFVNKRTDLQLKSLKNKQKFTISCNISLFLLVQSPENLILKTVLQNISLISYFYSINSRNLIVAIVMINQKA